MAPDRTLQNQEHRASGLNLVIAAIALWNTLYMERAVDHLRARDVAAPDALLASIAHGLGPRQPHRRLSLGRRRLRRGIQAVERPCRQALSRGVVDVPCSCLNAWFSVQTLRRAPQRRDF